MSQTIPAQNPIQTASAGLPERWLLGGGLFIVGFEWAVFGNTSVSAREVLYRLGDLPSFVINPDLFGLVTAVEFLVLFYCAFKGFRALRGQAPAAPQSA